MKLVLPDALHARPANLFVRAALRYAAAIEARVGQKRADAKNILQVLTLSAARGATLELSAVGEDADAALRALCELVDANFNADLVPETGDAASAGIALGRAVVVADAPARESKTANSESVSPAERATCLEHAFASVRADLEALVRTLPVAQAALFEPEIEIVRALEGPVVSAVRAGESLDDAIRAEAQSGLEGACNDLRSMSDLVLDARSRLLDAYGNDDAASLARLFADGLSDELVLVAETLTPSIVAAIPDRVTGIVAVGADGPPDRPGVGYASHAAILARGRGIALLFAPAHVVLAIQPGDSVVLDTRTPPARLWHLPSERLLAAAHAFRAEHLRAMQQDGARELEALTGFGCIRGEPFAVRVNIGSMYDSVPKGADGIGLVRTELLCLSRSRPPAAADQIAMLKLIAGKLGRGPLVVRLFDAGGDKPLPWLSAPPDAPEARGIELLRHHPETLQRQICAIAALAECTEVRLLIPLVRHADDVQVVRRLAPPLLPVGAMIETPEAVTRADEIAGAADFVCIGTNDLTAFAHGEDRAKAALGQSDPRVLSWIVDIVEAAHRRDRPVTVCGEMAGDESQAAVLVGLGVDAISVAPSRLACVKTALALMTASACREAGHRALSTERSA